MKIILFFIIALFVNADELQITKYISNEIPKIKVEYVNLNSQLQRVLKIDTKLVSHYNILIDKNKITNFAKIDNLSKYKGFNYLLRLNYKNRSLIALFYDLTTKKIKFYKKYRVSSYSLYPFLIHLLSYDINSAIGFKPIDWIRKKVVYSVNIAPKENAIFIADITLTYRKKIISGGFNIFPKWANKQQTEIYYTKYLREPTLFKYNIVTGRKERILSSPGMLAVSDVKGDNLLLTLAINDQPDIYKYNVKNKLLRRITKYRGIDTNGHFYGDDIVFISNRLGNPNVYKKDMKNGIVSKFIYYKKNQISLDVNKDNVVISTRETNKAFRKNTFNLLLINKNSNEIKRLTFGGKNMLPVFSEDGNTIFFIKELNFNSKIGIMRLKEHKIYYFRLNKIIQSFDL